MITDTRQRSEVNVYGTIPYESFGEWLNHNRLDTRTKWEVLIAATKRPRGTLTKWEKDRTPPGNLRKRIPMTFIRQVCEAMGLSKEAEEEGMYLGGWTLKKGLVVGDAAPTTDMVAAAQAIAEISRTALEAIVGICEYYGIEPATRTAMSARAIPIPTEELRLRPLSEEDFTESLRLR